MALGSRVADLFAAVADLTGVALRLGVPGGAVMALVGLAALTVATRRRRPLAIVGGATVGAVAAVALRGWFAAHLALSPAVTVVVLAAAGALGGAVSPVAFPFAAAALPGALLGAQVPLAGRSVLGAAVGALIAGVVGVALARAVAAAVASLCGGLLLGLGFLGMFGTTPIAREIAGRPAALVGFAVVLAVAGAAFQLARIPEGRADRSPVSPP